MSTTTTGTVTTTAVDGTLPATGKIPGHNVFTFDSVTISSNFDNGNIARCERNPNRSFEFRIWTAPDNLGTPYQSKHCAWFHFSISGLPMGCVLRIQIVNTSNHGGLYKHDMRPVYRSNSTNQRWVRIKSSVRYVKENDVPQLYFEHSIDQANDTIYFCFTYPYTYTQLQRELSEIDARHCGNDFTTSGSIFYQRELLTNSLDGRRIDLLTITSVDGAAPHLLQQQQQQHQQFASADSDDNSNNRNRSRSRSGSGSTRIISKPTTTTTTTTTTVNDLYAPLLSGLFPDASKPEHRPPLFPRKEIVFISARVHPGEVPAQHTFKGIVELLLDKDDLRAKALRSRYVFKLIPMLNPDGVYRGHFRMDQLGNNLNRYYIDPDPISQPAIFAAKSIVDYYASNNNSSSSSSSSSGSNMSSNSSGSGNSNIGKLSVYLDFHAHASKRGCFIYGNVLDNPEDQIQNQLYCKLIALNSAHFDYEGCLFSKEHMTRIDPGDAAKGLTAEGSGRVATYLQHRLIHSYTIECNYNTSRVGNEIAPTDGDPGGVNITPASVFTTNADKYTPSIWAGVGRACIVALLDIRGHNPCSRIPKSKFKTLDRVRNSVGMEVRARREYAGRAVNRDRERRRASVAQIQSGDSGRNARNISNNSNSSCSSRGRSGNSSSSDNVVDDNPDNALWRRVVAAVAEGTVETNGYNSNGNSSSRDSTPTGRSVRSNSVSAPDGVAADNCSNNNSSSNSSSEKMNGHKTAHAMFVSLKGATRPRNGRSERNTVAAVPMSAKATAAIGVADVESSFRSAASSIAAASAAAAAAAAAVAASGSLRASSSSSKTCSSSDSYINSNSNSSDHQQHQYFTEEAAPDPPLSDGIAANLKPPPNGNRIPPSATVVSPATTAATTAVLTTTAAVSLSVPKDDVAMLQPKGKLNAATRSSSEPAKRSSNNNNSSNIINSSGNSNRINNHNYMNYNTSDSDNSLNSQDKMQLTQSLDEQQSSRDNFPSMIPRRVSATAVTSAAAAAAIDGSDSDSRKSSSPALLSPGNSTGKSTGTSIYHKGAAAAGLRSQVNSREQNSRKTLGKKLSAAGVALLMDSHIATNSSSGSNSNMNGFKEAETAVEAAVVSTHSRGSWFDTDIEHTAAAVIPAGAGGDASDDVDCINDMIDAVSITRHYTTEENGATVYHGGRTQRSSSSNNNSSSSGVIDFALDLAVRGNAPQSGPSSPVNHNSISSTHNSSSSSNNGSINGSSSYSSSAVGRVAAGSNVRQLHQQQQQGTALITADTAVTDLSSKMPGIAITSFMHNSSSSNNNSSSSSNARSPRYPVSARAVLEHVDLPASLPVESDYLPAIGNSNNNSISNSSYSNNSSSSSSSSSRQSNPHLQKSHRSNDDLPLLAAAAVVGSSSSSKDISEVSPSDQKPMMRSPRALLQLQSAPTTTATATIVTSIGSNDASEIDAGATTNSSSSSRANSTQQQQLQGAGKRKGFLK